MDFCRNVPEAFVFQPEYPKDEAISPDFSKPGSHSASLDDLFPSENTEGDVGLEWLSIFVEDCLSSSGNCIPPPLTHHSTPKPSNPCNFQKPTLQTPPSLQDFSVPGKPRSKRKRTTTATATTTFPIPTTTQLRSSVSSHFQHPQSQSQTQNQTQPFNLTISSDPPLLHQAYWLADSELIVPKKEINSNSATSYTSNTSTSGDDDEEEEGEERIGEKGSELGKDNNVGSSGSCEGTMVQPRRCSHCLAQRTPQWRAGPLGPKTLCNACGVRFKSGRLLPEYRPAKSPTFVSYKHSNSHKKVMEMRMSILSSISTTDYDHHQ